MAQRQSGFARQPLELYETPAWVLDALLSCVRVLPRVWEPACGHGKLARRLQEHGFRVHAPDIVDWGSMLQEAEEDFLQAPMLPSAGKWAILTNPPYGPGGKQATAFIEHALKLTAKKRGQVAMLLHA